MQAQRVKQIIPQFLVTKERKIPVGDKFFAEIENLQTSYLGWRVTDGQYERMLTPNVCIMQKKQLIF